MDARGPARPVRREMVAAAAAGTRGAWVGGTLKSASESGPGSAGGSRNGVRARGRAREEGGVASSLRPLGPSRFGFPAPGPSLRLGPGRAGPSSGPCESSVQPR